MSRTPPSWPPASAELPDRHPQAPAPGTRLGPHYDWCFGCGDEQSAGLRLRGTAGEGQTVHAEFTVTRAHQGAPGIAHGGLLACAFDEALGAVVGHLVREPAVTATLNTEFLRPVPVGARLHIAARLDGLAGRQVYVSATGRLDQADGPIAARARAVFATVAPNHFATHVRGTDATH